MLQVIKFIIPVTLGFILFNSCTKPQAPNPPDWVKALSIYEIMPKNFSPSQDIKGIRESLTKIRTLYVSAIAITPLTPNASINSTFNPGDPYAATDFSVLDTTLGESQDLINLVKEAHENKLKIFFEFDISYTAPNHVWRQAKPSFYKSNEKKVNQLYNKEYITLNYDNKDTRSSVLKILKKWKSQYKPDGIIILNTEILPSDFNQELMNSLKSEDFLLASGSNYPTDSSKIVYDTYFNHTLYDALKKISKNEATSSDFKAIVEANKNSKFKSTAIQFTRTAKINEIDEAETLMFQHYYKMPSLLAITLGGIPWILNGQEEPMFIKLDVAKPTFVERNYQYCLEFYRSLFIHRKENGALYSLEDNLPEIISDSEDVLAFERKIGKNHITVFANLRDSTSSFKITKDYPQHMEFFTRNKVDFMSGYEYRLGPHQFILLTNKY